MISLKHVTWEHEFPVSHIWPFSNITKYSAFAFDFKLYFHLYLSLYIKRRNITRTQHCFTYNIFKCVFYGCFVNSAVISFSILITVTTYICAHDWPMPEDYMLHNQTVKITNHSFKCFRQGQRNGFETSLFWISKTRCSEIMNTSNY